MDILKKRAAEEETSHMTSIIEPFDEEKFLSGQLVRAPWGHPASIVRTWKQALFLVQPETLLRWHREPFRLFWKHKSKANEAHVALRNGRAKRREYFERSLPYFLFTDEENTSSLCLVAERDA